MEYTLKSNSLFIDKTGLLNGLQRGEELAFALLYNQYADLLYSYGTGLGFAKEDIEDSMQEVFCNLYLNHSKINGINNLKDAIIFPNIIPLLERKASLIASVDGKR